MERFSLERKIFALCLFIILWFFSYLSQKCKKTQSSFSYIQKKSYFCWHIYKPLDNIFNIVEKNGECLQIREAFAFLLKE